MFSNFCLFIYSTQLSKVFVTMIWWGIYSNMEIIMKTVLKAKRRWLIPDYIECVFYLLLHYFKIHLNSHSHYLEIWIYWGAVRNALNNTLQLCLYICLEPISLCLVCLHGVAYSHNTFGICLYSIDSYSVWAIFCSFWMFSSWKMNPSHHSFFTKA